MIFGSVCSGIEAASTAWEPLGWKAAWFAEIEPFPSAVLAHHWPEVPNLGDFTTIRDRIASWEVPAPEVLVGGTPCQAFSVAGLRQSMGDSRGQLTLEFVRLANGIDAARSLLGIPECIVVWENVPGVLNTPDNAFGCFLAGLAGEDDPLLPPGGRWSNAGRVLGPTRAVAWRILDAQYLGVAQRRRRVFVVASAREGFDPTEILFEFDGVRRDSPPSREPGKGFAAVAGTLAASGGRMERPAGNANELDFCVPVGVSEIPDLAHCLRSGASKADKHESTTYVVAPQQQVFGGNRCSGPIDIAPALTASASASGRLDFESEAFVATCFDTTQITSVANRSNPQPGDPCHPLAAGAHPPAVAFSCKDHGADAGEIAPTMRSMGHRGSHANGGGQLAVAWDIRNGLNSHGSVVGSDKAFTLKSSDYKDVQVVGQCATGDIFHTLRAEGFDASEDGTGRGVGAVAVGSDSLYIKGVNQGEQDASAQEADAREVLHLLREEVGEEAFAEWRSRVLDPLQRPEVLRSPLHGPGLRQAPYEEESAVDDGAPPRPEAVPSIQLRDLWENGPDRRTPQGLRLEEQLRRQSRQALPVVPPQGSPWAQVRRLTPTEAERLQGFPDGHTLIPWRGKPADQCPDGPRYKALGNSMAVPVMRWIAERIEKVLAKMAEAE